MTDALRNYVNVRLDIVRLSEARLEYVLLEQTHIGDGDYKSAEFVRTHITEIEDQIVYLKSLL